MPDDIDDITEKQQFLFERKIEKIRAAAQTKHAPFCRLCNAPIPEARPSDVCVDCQTDIERKQRRKR